MKKCSSGNMIVRRIFHNTNQYHTGILFQVKRVSVSQYLLSVDVNDRVYLWLATRIFGCDSLGWCRAFRIRFKDIDL